jgi:hypothetical protein
MASPPPAAAVPMMNLRRELFVTAAFLRMVRIVLPRA